jgi:hypothetical protein
LNEKVVSSVPPRVFLFASDISPARNWPPAPKSRQNSAAVLKNMGRAAGSVGIQPNAIGTSAAQPMARPSRPSGVGSPKGTAAFGVVGALMARAQ